MKQFDIKEIDLTKYLFFTGKGGVGKTSTACASAISLADEGNEVLLISTDPASNLQDVFETELDNKGVRIEGVDGLTVANLDPIEAANEYKESVVAPYRGQLPDSVIENMEEQLSGSCTVEIAAFNEFSKFITASDLKDKYDYIIFDTAPTGHTLRMLQLPSAWTNFISESTHGASCLGQLSGLEEEKETYKFAVDTLADGKLTSLVLVARPEETPLLEANRASAELSELGINNQILIINGLLSGHDDEVSKAFYKKQEESLDAMPEGLKDLKTFFIPLRGYNLNSIENLRSLLIEDKEYTSDVDININESTSLKDVVDDLYKNEKKVIFTMGKGGVGKTTIASAIAKGLRDKGQKVHLTTTDPANHLTGMLEEDDLLTISHIDEEEELKKYQEEVLENAKKTMSDDDLEYVKEDLRSPCTQEIAVFRAFADIVDRADDEVVVIDTAPTGHTLLLLDSTESYNQEIEKNQGNVPESAKKLLPRLKNSDETEVLIVTLAEPTPFYESKRLEEDLKRAGIYSKWWIINSSIYKTGSRNKTLEAKANSELEWINKVDERTDGNFTIIPWSSDEIKGSNLDKLIK
ncbi:arsenical pump-driving ATPase [Anaerococcus sp.]|uniref:arsenical pump-driving ATPase n=1 Tax=Anaerococcus sp. TaxID=1872515 RepID=UPI0029029343|nr:arsenical pump-driving ATPase [Anaerococcus sp.]MDU1829186.1 arsenical pump-driving ATPase [Anaerococcus sp.]MDU1864488.1 arsenical pump-driving ATPase [Anaerococcus sp.]